MKLSELLSMLSLREVRGSLDIEISGVNMDSRQVKPGDLFVAVKGTQTDGHAYIGKAVEQGAAAVLLCEDLPADAPEGVTFVRVDNTELAIGPVATHFYGDPTERLQLVLRSIPRPTL